MVEAVHQFARHFEHRLLVFASRYGRGLEQGDVGSLRDGIAEKAQGDVSLEVAHLNLGLHGRVALYAADGDEVHQIGGQLGQLDNLALYEQRALLGVETCREVVECHLDNVLANLLRIVGIIGQRLHVGHENKHLVKVASILKFNAATERTYIVSQVQFARWTVASQYNLSHIYDSFS